MHIIASFAKRKLKVRELVRETLLTEISFAPQGMTGDYTLLAWDKEQHNYLRLNIGKEAIKHIIEVYNVENDKDEPNKNLK